MSYNTKSLKTDLSGKKPVPQYFNPSADNYEVLYGAHGASRNIIYDKDGNPLFTAGNPARVSDAVLHDKVDTLLTKITSLEDELESIRTSDGIKKIANTVPVELKGSNAQLLKEDLESTALLGLGTNYTRRWGATNGSTIAQIKPLDVSNYREKMIRVVNDHDVQIKVRFEAHKLITGNSPIYISGEWDVGAGSSVLISSADDPLLACPIIGLVAAVSTTTPVQTGTVSVEFYAGGVV